MRAEGHRMKLAGYRCLYVRDAMVRHVGSATSGKGNDSMSITAMGLGGE
jgi:GT2 family glycosyltransferase